MFGSLKQKVCVLVGDTWVNEKSSGRWGWKIFKTLVWNARNLDFDCQNFEHWHVKMFFPKIILVATWMSGRSITTLLNGPSETWWELLLGGCEYGDALDQGESTGLVTAREEGRVMRKGKDFFLVLASGSKGYHSFTVKNRTSFRNRRKEEQLWLNSVGYVDLEVPRRPPCEAVHKPTGSLWFRRKIRAVHRFGNYH